MPPKREPKQYSTSLADLTDDEGEHENGLSHETDSAGGASEEQDDDSTSSSETEASAVELEDKANLSSLAAPIAIAENEYTKSLEMLQRIQEITGGCDIDIPQICVAGDQSSGKSSLLRSLTGVPFPENSGICTKVAARVQCRQDKQRSTDLFEIKDAANEAWVQTSFDEVSKKILKAQKALLGGKNTAKKICTDSEINVRVTGPNHMDIIVNDLPGLIHTGPGMHETRALIEKYVQRERTLILLVSEAQRDEETVAAIELAKQVDPESKRTMRVLTKFDSFDSRESKAAATKLICSQEDMHLGTHAVACRVKGDKKYDDAAETRELKALKLPPLRMGIESLKARLPKVFAELIRTNLPGMLESVHTRLHEAAQELKAIGIDAINPNFMIEKFCQASLEASEDVEQRLSKHLRNLQETVHETRDIITEDFVKGNFPENLFKVPFFQGDAPYKKCWQEVISKWRLILSDYMASAEDVMISSLSEVELQSMDGVSLRLYTAAADLWKRFCKDTLFPEFRVSCEEALKKECEFGTVNHYLTDKFAEEVVLPKGLAEDFLRNITEHDLEAHSDHEDCVRNIRQKLNAARERWVKKCATQTLHAHQQRRVYATLEANWAVEKKTFTDLVHKESMALLQKRRRWILGELQCDKDILAEALEDSDTVQKREHLKSVVEKMSACKAEIRKYMCEAEIHKNK